ncbi:membrane hypothetical protein [uncultured delta proteobacterium]|uniref:Cobalt transport protein n=1 Tax=uncultured delta proteobacterium TaxID=34034 RepID=A0A212KDJ1_9DELT|nr:membrane hypothetical protein [uncultured delta proteobacterium]
MAFSRPFSERLARRVRSGLVRLDTRALVAFVSVAGVLAWVMPWPVTAFFFAAACVIALTAVVELRDGRAALAAYGIFVLIWTVSQLMLYLFEHPGEFGAANVQAALLGGRLFTLLGLALAVPLAATPLTLGRTLTWYLGWLVGAEKWVCGTLLRGKVRPVLAEGVWRAALALSLMMAFFPRSLRAMKELRRSMLMRAPRLRLHKRMALMGLALIRVVSSQTWDMTLAIASRNVYRPEPWEWPKHS